MGSCRAGQAQLTEDLIEDKMLPSFSYGGICFLPHSSLSCLCFSQWWFSTSGGWGSIQIKKSKSVKEKETEARNRKYCSENMSRVNSSTNDYNVFQSFSTVKSLFSVHQITFCYFPRTAKHHTGSTCSFTRFSWIPRLYLDGKTDSQNLGKKIRIFLSSFSSPCQ